MKYFIVSIDFDDYDRMISDHKLPPGRCFQCMTEEEAERAMAVNARWKEPTRLFRTPEWRQQNEQETA